MNEKTLITIKEEVARRVGIKCDIQHGMSHLNNVRDSALKIAEHHKVDTNLLEAICYLHDLTYTHYNPGIITYFWEGAYVKKLLPELLDKIKINGKDREIIINACGKHPHSFPWTKLNSKEDIYSQILQDADTLDFLSVARLDGFFHVNLKFFDLLKKYLIHNQPQILSKFLNLETSKQLLKSSYGGEFIRPRYLEWNKGCENTYVLLHGYADNAEMFSPIKDILKDKHLVAINFPMVYSNKKMYSIKFLSKYVKSIIDELEIQDYSLIGFSLGGLISLKVAKNNPRVKEIILLNSFPSLINNTILRNLYHVVKVLILNRWFLSLYSKINTNDDVRAIFKSPYINKVTKKYMADHYRSVFGTLFKCIDFNGSRIYRRNRSI